MGFEKALEATIPTLQQRVRHLFPVTQKGVYLNHAAVGPLCGPAFQAMQAHLQDSLEYGSLHYGEWLKAYAGLRQAAATLLNANADEIAVVKNTSEGISTVANGIKWNTGDRIVAFLEEFPSNYYPWLRLQAQGVEITWLSIYDELDKIAAAAKGARLLAISFVNYLSGYRVNLAALGRICRENNCLFFVDAIQGLGVWPVDVERDCIDALAADGHKWLLGPEGNGILYVRRDVMSFIEPTEFGWTTPAKYYDYGSRDMTLRPDAGRYECGTLNTAGCYGLKAAIETLLEVGTDEVGAVVDQLAQDIENDVRAKGYEILAERTGDTGSGIVSFRHERLDCRALMKTLEEHGALASLRQGCIRMAPHFYITREEIASVLELVPAL